MQPNPQDVARLVDRIKPILAGYPPEIQGAVIADLLSIFLAGHHPLIRDSIRDETVLCAVKLIEANENILFPNGLPDGW